MSLEIIKEKVAQYVLEIIKEKVAQAVDILKKKILICGLHLFRKPRF